MANTHLITAIDAAINSGMMRAVDVFAMGAEVNGDITAALKELVDIAWATRHDTRDEIHTARKAIYNASNAHMVEVRAAA